PPHPPPTAPLLPYTTLFRSVDTASHRVIKAIPVGTNPHFLVLGPDGRIWGTNTGGTDIYVIDPGTQDKIASINVGPSPQQIAFRSEEHTSELQSRENLVCRL